MSGWRAAFVTLLLSYAAGVLAVRWLIFHSLALDAPVVAGIIAAPVVQTAGWLGWRRLFQRRARR
jgi:hypothetical protein